MSIEVYFKGYRMGFVEKKKAYEVRDMLMDHKLEYCVVEDVKEIPDQCPEIILRVYYENKYGFELVPDRNGEIDWTVVSDEELKGDTTPEFHAIWETYELVYRRLKDYGLSPETLDPESYNYHQLIEDDAFMEEVVHELNRGMIHDQAEKRLWLRDAWRRRGWGDNKILRKRINDYTRNNCILIL